MGMKKTLCSKEILCRNSIFIMIYDLYICISLYPCLMCLHSVAPSKISSCLGLHRVFFSCCSRSKGRAHEAQNHPPGMSSPAPGDYGAAGSLGVGWVLSQPRVESGWNWCMDVSKSSIFDRIFHYKPSILGYPYFWKHPYQSKSIMSLHPGRLTWNLRKDCLF